MQILRCGLSYNVKSRPKCLDNKFGINTLTKEACLHSDFICNRHSDVYQE